jgi:hypothetical protein
MNDCTAMKKKNTSKLPSWLLLVIKTRDAINTNKLLKIMKVVILDSLLKESLLVLKIVIINIKGISANINHIKIKRKSEFGVNSKK